MGPFDVARQHWVMAPGEGAELWSRWQDEGVVSIGWSRLGDLRQYESIDDVLDVLLKSVGERRPTNQARICFEFCNGIQKGAYVYAKRGLDAVLGHGVVISDYQYQPDRAGHHHVRSVNWLSDDQWDRPTEDWPELPVKTLTKVKADLLLYDTIEAYWRAVVSRGGAQLEGDLTSAVPVGGQQVITVSGDESLLGSQVDLKGQGGGGGPWPTGASESAKVIGDRAEQLVFNHLSGQGRAALRWVASEGLHPGWDLQYEQDGHTVAIEVKGTRSSLFKSVELTDNELSAAKGMRETYWLYLVADCFGPEPQIQRIQDPWDKIERGELAVSPTRWRLKRSQQEVGSRRR